MAKVFFHTADRQLTLANKTLLKSFIEALFKKEKQPLGEIRYIFCSDDYLLQINRDHLQHDYYTDIITFDLSEGEEIISEVYISKDRVRDNATTLSVPFATEMLRVLFHGALHLCGYKDKNKVQSAKMREMEELYLKKYAAYIKKRIG